MKTTPTLSSPSILMMEMGDRDVNGLIADIDKGILITGFNGGNSNSTTGDFSYGVEGFLIENGKLTDPIKDVNIIGNGPQALANIIAVGNDLKIDNGTWTCGKDQSAAVSCGIPTVLVRSLTVGGN